MIQYDFISGHCTITNGSLSGVSGILILFDYGQITKAGIISSFAGEMIAADKSDNDVKCKILGEWQYTSEYACRMTHIVDGRVHHTRNYDKDHHLLVHASGGISDFILLGNANISYAVGSLGIVDTSLNLGFPCNAPSIATVPITAIAAGIVFISIYVSSYRMQRRSKSVKTKKKSRRVQKRIRQMISSLSRLISYRIETKGGHPNQ